MTAAPGRLTLVTGEAVVEVLAGRGLVPLRVGLLAAAVAAGARWAAVAHRLRAVAGRGLSLWTTVAGLLARTTVRA